MESSNNTSPFDQKLADSFVGKYILVGVTYLDHAGQLLEQKQFHGIVESVTRAGVKIALRGINEGKVWNMPPALESIRPASTGSYKLRTTDETIENPDLLATWEVTKPHQH